MPCPPKLGIYSVHRHSKLTTPPLVFDHISSRCERVLLPLHRRTLYPAPHGAPRILLHADRPAARKCPSSFPPSICSSAWATTSPSWCIRRLDRSTDWTTANGICDPLRRSEE